MGTPKGAPIAVVLIGLLATVATMAGDRPLRSAAPPTAVRSNNCVPNDVVPVGHICILLG